MSEEKVIEERIANYCVSERLYVHTAFPQVQQRGDEMLRQRLVEDGCNSIKFLPWERIYVEAFIDDEGASHDGEWIWQRSGIGLREGRRSHERRQPNRC